MRTEKEINQRIEQLEKYLLQLRGDFGKQVSADMLPVEIAKVEGNINALSWILCLEESPDA